MNEEGSAEIREKFMPASLRVQRSNPENLRDNSDETAQIDFRETGQTVANSLTAAAHELKTPLVLLRQLAFQIDDEKIAARVKLTSERALRLVDGLTKTARLDDGLFALAPLDVRRSLAESLREISPLAAAKNVAIAPPRISRKLPMAVGNRELLHAILLNLLDNALDYTRGKIELTVRKKRAELEVCVRDYGEIIEPNEFKNLAKNLGRRGQILSSRPLSSGLGLMVAGQMSRAMNGGLTVVRHRRGGLTFAITLPMIQQLSLLEM